MARVEEQVQVVAQKRGWASTYGTVPRTVFLLGAALLVMRSAESFYVPILPLYVRVLDASLPLFLVGLISSIHRLGIVVVGPFAGGWSDRIGLRVPFIAGVLVASFASLLGGGAFGAPDLTLYRLLSGVGFGTLTIAAMAFANQVTTAENRATAMSLLSASTLAGASIGALTGGLIASGFTPALLGYRATFFAGGGVQLLVGVYAFFLIGHRALQPAMAAASHGHGTPFGALIRNRGVTLTASAAFLFGVSLGAFLYFTVPLLGDSLGFSPSQIGMVVGGFGAGHVVGALFLGPLSDRVGLRKPFVFAALFGLGLSILFFATLQNPFLMASTTVVLGFLTAPWCGIAPALVAESAPGQPASAIALQKSGEQLGIFVGPILGGVLIAAAGYTPALIIYGAIAIASSLMFLAWVPEPRKAQQCAACK